MTTRAHDESHMWHTKKLSVRCRLQKIHAVPEGHHGVLAASPTNSFTILKPFPAVGRLVRCSARWWLLSGSLSRASTLCSLVGITPPGFEEPVVGQVRSLQMGADEDIVAAANGFVDVYMYV